MYRGWVLTGQGKDEVDLLSSLQPSQEEKEKREQRIQKAKKALGPKVPKVDSAPDPDWERDLERLKLGLMPLYPQYVSIPERVESLLRDVTDEDIAAILKTLESKGFIEVAASSDKNHFSMRRGRATHITIAEDSNRQGCQFG